jgi:hypothetical protein
VKGTFKNWTLPPQRGRLKIKDVADGGDGLQIWRVAANILNKQSGLPSSLGLGGEGAKTPRTIKPRLITKCSIKSHTWPDS